jgi:hypothetical protein
MNETATAKGKSASRWCEELTQHGYCIVEDLALAQAQPPGAVDALAPEHTELIAKLKNGIVRNAA